MRIMLLLIVIGLLATGCHQNGTVTANKPNHAPIAAAAVPAVGQDVAALFARAKNGAPIRCVTLGGSITQAGGETWIGPWLRSNFPKSAVTVVNAGMSATGSLLGCFRIERDVIACQPDLVLIEYVVNDGGQSDDEAIWTVESIVRRLKMLPTPPAIVFVQAASRTGSNTARHARVAAHYGLAIIDLDLQTHAYLKSSQMKWEDFFSDSVHPNAKGHELYARFIGTGLTPYLSASAAVPAFLPPQLSAKKLLLDGMMAPVAVGSGWKRESSLPFWWNRFFLGVTASDEPGATLVLPFRAGIVGMMYPLDRNYGSMLVSVDGGIPRYVALNYRGGYDLSMFGFDLGNREHHLSLVVSNGPVKLGYLLLGDCGAGPVSTAPQGEYTASRLSRLRMAPVTGWEWCGPFGDLSRPTPDDKAMVTELKSCYPPETIWNNWTKLSSTQSRIDYAALTGQRDRGVCYARTSFNAGQGGARLMFLAVDYWAVLYLNGKEVKSVDANHGHAGRFLAFPLTFAPGINSLMIKTHAGRGGHVFELRVEAKSSR